MIYTFDIYRDNEVLSTVGVDEENKQVAYVWFADDVLNDILRMVVNMPFLTIKTNCCIDGIYTVMKEEIHIYDKRFYNALRNQLTDYDFTELTVHNEKSLQKVMQQFNGGN